MELVQTAILTIEPTIRTPNIVFDRIQGSLEISGVSVPENGQQFYTPVLGWLSHYMMSPAKHTHVSICLDYFNISSSKMILFIFYKLMELQKNGSEVTVHWLYSDDELLEAGCDYEHMTKLKFEYSKIPAAKTGSN